MSQPSGQGKEGFVCPRSSSRLFACQRRKGGYRPLTEGSPLVFLVGAVGIEPTSPKRLGYGQLSPPHCSTHPSMLSERMTGHDPATSNLASSRSTI